MPNRRLDPHRATAPARASRRAAMLVAPAVALALAALHQPARPRAEAAVTSPIVLSANFQSAGLPAGWTVDRPGVWSVRNGRLHARLPKKKQEKSFAWFGHESWKDYQLDFDVIGLRGVDKGLAVRAQGDEGIGIDLRGPGYDDIVMYRGYAQLGKAAVRNENGKWHHVRVVVRGGRYQVYVNHQLKIDYLDEKNERPAGRIALAAYTGGNGENEVAFDNVVVRALH